LIFARAKFRVTTVTNNFDFLHGCFKEYLLEEWTLSKNTKQKNNKNKNHEKSKSLNRIIKLA
jgi:hypothetical protein